MDCKINQPLKMKKKNQSTKSLDPFELILLISIKVLNSIKKCTITKKL